MPDKKIAAEEPQTFPAMPTPAAETPVAAEPAPSAYYVILHDAVDAHAKDAIVNGAALGGADAIARLLDLGAIRPL